MAKKQDEQLDQNEIKAPEAISPPEVSADPAPEKQSKGSKKPKEEAPRELSKEEIHEQSLERLEEMKHLFGGELADEKVAINHNIDRVHVSLVREMLGRKAENKLHLSDGNHEMISLLHKKLKSNGRI